MHSLFKNTSRLTGAAALALTLPLALASCSSTPKVKKASTVAYREGVPGGTLVEAYKIPVTVAEVDDAARKVTFVAPDGSRNIFAAAPGDPAFDRLRVGSRFEAAVTRELVIFLGQDRVAVEQNPITPAVFTPADAQSGALRSETVQRLARVEAVDGKRRQTALVFADGVSKTFPIRKDVDPQQIKPGSEVVIRTSSWVVLTQGKP
jgi:hypothetical protein